MQDSKTVTTFTCPFSFGDRVNVDQDKSIIGVVVGFCWIDADGCSVKVSWFHNGEEKQIWFHDRRLSHA